MTSKANYYVVTGTSRGIGKALVENLLLTSSNRIIGISRSEGIKHERYKHFQFDLSDLKQFPEVVDQIFHFETKPERIVLINNAAILGEVGPFGTINSKSLIDVYTINVIAPSIIMNAFIKKFMEDKVEKLIINISSGAALRPIDGWGAYCSSKAAINMMSEVASIECNLLNNGFKIFSLAPGVVDTAMQSEIRNADPGKFSDFDRFIKLKENGELSDPADTAEKIVYLINNAHDFKDVLQDVRKF